jgi:AcrR family transcriptional regulator
MFQELREALNRLRESGRPVTMRALAQAAGVSRATLYRRYGGRERVQAALGEALGGRADEARIFAAVRQVLGRRGFRGTTLEAVADSAKVGIATLYRRYGDRDGLLRAFLAQVPVRKRASRLRAANEGELRGTLERFAAEMLEEIASSSEVMKAALGDPESAAVVGRLRDPRRGISAGLGRFFRACLRRGLLAPAPPEELVSAFSSLVLGAGFLEPAMLGVPLPEAPKAAVLVVRQFLDGALPRPSARGR